MTIMTELRNMALDLCSRYEIPPITGVVFPPYVADGQPKDCEFMAMALEGGAGGLSYVLLPGSSAADYEDLNPQAFVGHAPVDYAAAFGGSDPAPNMLGLAAINAICQQVMRVTATEPAVATDSLGLMQIKAEDRIGMVGFFPPLLKYVRACDAQLIIVEKNPALLERYPKLPVTLDVKALQGCNKILCTSTCVLNDSLEEVLGHCRQAEHISVLGPTAGYFPDPLFKRGVDVVGGRQVVDGPLLLKLIAERKPWGVATRKLCYDARDYQPLV